MKTVKEASKVPETESPEIQDQVRDCLDKKVDVGGKMPMPSGPGIIKLNFKNKVFVQEADESEISLLVDPQAKKMVLKSSPGANFIDVRTAERQARSFPKIGIPLKSGESVGRGFDFQIENDIGPPDKLRHSPRQVYMGPNRQ